MKKRHLTYQHHISSFLQNLTLNADTPEVIVIDTIGTLLSLEIAIPASFKINCFKHFLPPMVIYHEIEFIQYHAPDKEFVVMSVRVWGKSIRYKDKRVIAGQFHHIDSDGGHLAALKGVGNPNGVCRGIQWPG